MVTAVSPRYAVVLLRGGSKMRVFEEQGLSERGNGGAAGEQKDLTALEWTRSKWRLRDTRAPWLRCGRGVSGNGSPGDSHTVSKFGK